MIPKDTFKEDRIIEVNLKGGKKIPLRLYITEKGVTFSARLKEEEEPNKESLDLLKLFDDRLHELCIVDLSKTHVHVPDKITFP